MTRRSWRGCNRRCRRGRGNPRSSPPRNGSDGRRRRPTKPRSATGARATRAGAAPGATATCPPRRCTSRLRCCSSGSPRCTSGSGSPRRRCTARDPSWRSGRTAAYPTPLAALPSRTSPRRSSRAGRMTLTSTTSWAPTRGPNSWSERSTSTSAPPASAPRPPTPWRPSPMNAASRGLRRPRHRRRLRLRRPSSRARGATPRLSPRLKTRASSAATTRTARPRIPATRRT
mmetsp:Transcript_2429/g.11059  ORF Transcript_2429/g.11059 Transcript_2429/m.11059 type:complete len:230 (-) Transcript_2429:344-1033(-)